MEIKKTEKANLENKKLLFLEIGLIVALAAVFVAFEWQTEEQQIIELEDTTQTRRHYTSHRGGRSHRYTD